MERQVFVSHAADDPDWPAQAVEAVALAIHEAGIGVRLDLWHQRDIGLRPSLSEWQDWMDEAIDGSSHILCLVSSRYRQLWARKPEDAGGYGLAFESIHMSHILYLLKQRNHGRILTLRPEGSDYDCIPRTLAMDCSAYVWAKECALLLSHVGRAALPGHVVSPAHKPDVTTAIAVTPATPSPATRPPAQAAQRPAPTAQLRPSWASDCGEDGYGRWADLTVNGAIQRMRWIPPTGPEGFWMGSSQAERDAVEDKYVRDEANKREHAPRCVVVADGFWLADTPCTQAFWEAVRGKNPSHFNKGAKAPERPVESVSWDDVMDKFIARFAAMPAQGGDRLCLPTEVEWEYAARAGTVTAYWWGDAWDATRGNVDVTGARGWNDAEGTTPVKLYMPNPWGLYDIHGNLWEWCADDVWQPRRDDAPKARSGQALRVVRGGSWIARPGGARAAVRLGWLRGHVARSLGFRFALRSSSGPEGRPGGPGG